MKNVQNVIEVPHKMQGNQNPAETHRKCVIESGTYADADKIPESAKN